MSGYEAISTVGGLLPSDLLERVRAGDKNLEGTSAESYGLVPGERLNDHITRSWNRLRGVWESYRQQLDALPGSDRGTTLTRQRWCRPLLDELGFAGLPTASGTEIDGKSYSISHMWADSVPVHQMGARLEIDRKAAGVAGAAAASPHGLVQEFLNRSDDHLWGIVTNGDLLRVLRDNASLTKQAYVEFDLQAMFDGNHYGDFAVFWLTCHRTRFEGDPPEKCLLEQWSVEAAATGTRALDKLRDGVETAIESLGEGFIAHPDNSALREALRSGQLSNADLQRQTLRVVYRLLFLLVAESRGLLHAPGADPTAVERYRRFYSVDRLRNLALLRRGSSHGDLWEGLRLTMNGLWHDGVPSLALAPLGSALWSPSSIVSLADTSIDNRHLLGAVRALCFVRDDESRSERAVDYKNLGAEELGSIYESLLELHAEADVDARTFVLSTAAGNERKTTGSYYTPTSLINELLDSALDPVLDEAARKPEPETAILDLKVIDPAAGSGHFLIAAAHRIAGRLASVRAGGGEPAPNQLRSALRDVVSHCMYAIDVNPMAVELCKVSMWLEAMEPGKPLGFLDHRIVAGNALLGATPELLAEGISDDAFAPLTGDDKTWVTSLKKRNKAARKGQGELFAAAGASLVEALAESVVEVVNIDEDTVAAVDEKAARWDALVDSDDYRSAVFAADVWCAAFVAPKTKDDVDIIHSDFVAATESPRSVAADLRETVDQLVDEYGFLHWHLAFLDVFDSEGNGGFDVVLGNPPWEKVKLSEKEFFASRDPEIAELSGAKRKKAIAALEESDPTLFAEYQAALRHSEGMSHFARNSGRYPLNGRGDVNTYAVFAELMRDAASPTGRTGVIVPTGIATDDTTKFFFADCVDDKRLVSLFDFENAAPIFPGVHRSYKFCLLTMSGMERPTDEANFVFFAHQTTDLTDPERRFTLSAPDLALMNPNSKNAPVFRHSSDAVLVAGIYQRNPILIRRADTIESPWQARLRTEYHMTNDSDRFVEVEDLERLGAVPVGNSWDLSDDVWLPLLEGRSGHQFDHRFGTSINGEVVASSLEQHEDPAYLARPSKWVKQRDWRTRAELAGHGTTSALLGFRRVARDTDERTTIAALLPFLPPANSWILTVGPDAPALIEIATIYNSFAFDYVSRTSLSQPSFPQGVFEQLPVPHPSQIEKFEQDIAVPSFFRDRGIELTCTAYDMVGLLAALGRPATPYRWDAARREAIRAELDAGHCHVFGLLREDVEHVMESFPVVRRRDESKYGEYRTKRLVLARYDAMAEAAATGTEYQTTLNPPPADPSLTHDPLTRPEWADCYLEGVEA